jgi:hypothetical protein
MRIASRTAVRLTPIISQMRASDGSASPGATSPRTMPVPMRSATCE